MNKQEKTREVESLREALKGAPSTFVLSYRGLTVGQVSALRKKVRATSSRYRVVKNRLALRALRETPFEALAGELKGPTAIAYAAGDAAALAKVLDEFARENQGLQLKAGLVDGRVVTPAQIKAIADLPSREILVARLLSVLRAPMVRVVTVLQAPARGLVRAMDEIAKQKQAAGVPAPAGETPQA